MSLEIKGEKCPICKAYLFEEEEIAVCPVCGAPHHRECFINAGKCGMEEFHGTENQYDIAKKNKAKEENKEKENETKTNNNVEVECPSCHNRYSMNEPSCPSCGMQNIYGKAMFFGVDFFGGIDKNTDLGEGHTAEKVRNFVITGTERVIPNFFKFKLGKKVNFSVWSMLFPTAKFAFRKMYKEAFLSGVIEIAASLLVLPLARVISQTDFNGYAELYNLIYSSNAGLLLMATIGSYLTIALRVLSGLFADRLYYKHVIRSLTEIDAKTEDENEKFALYRKRGGVNIFAFLIALMAVQQLPTIIIEIVNKFLS